MDMCNNTESAPSLVGVSGFPMAMAWLINASVLVDLITSGLN